MRVAVSKPSPLIDAPRFTLRDQKGHPHSLDDFLAKGPVLLVFHRGTW
jgi:peroxiredoxin